MQLRSRDDLATLMRTKGLKTDRALAEAADLHHSTIHRIRVDTNYQCHLDTAAAIAQALQVDVKALFRPAEQDIPSQVEDS